MSKEKPKGHGAEQVDLRHDADVPPRSRYRHGLTAVASLPELERHDDDDADECHDGDENKRTVIKAKMIK
ncbi:unnamed protein product [marine sediment metagenome]|uniref:Uncharacterized protein n=1 Tax=marine sediment metagenome TaxID=412755 RepID=X0RVJ0_9ZZZZ